MISPSLSRDIRQVVMKAKHGLALRSVVPLRHSLSFVGFWKLTLKAMYVRNYRKSMPNVYSGVYTLSTMGNMVGMYITANQTVCRII